MSLKPSTEGRGLRIDAIWDIETANWDTFVCGALWTQDSGLEVFRNEDDLAEALLSLPQGHNAWAHAGGRFDVLWLLDWCRRRAQIPKARITMSGSTIASLAIKGGPILRDSCRLIPMTLRQACEMFEGATQKQHLELPCQCGKDCGGYCSIAPNMRADLRRRLEEYLGADIEALRDTLLALWDYADAHGIKLAGTLAGTTWKTAQILCGLEDADWEVHAYKLAREGYYGGRVEAAILEAAKVWRYDRTQAYPAALIKPLPVGDFKVLEGKKAALAYARGKPGVYGACVNVPEMIAPPLPSRHGVRLTYPWGKVEGSWPRDELLRAEEVGSKIQNFRSAIVWDEEKAILKPYMRRCFELREAAPTKALKTWEKLRANSLTGAFAQDPERDIIAFGDYADDIQYEQVGRYDWIWRKKIFHISNRAHVHWAATLTGDARVELHREIVHADKDWCYSDTDSNIATRKLTRNVGSGLGLWKFEGKARDFEVIAPKVYSYLDEDGKRFARAKGIPDAIRKWDAIKARETIAIDSGVKSFLSAARGDKLFERRKDSRKLKEPGAWVGARIRDGGRTRAPNVTDLQSLPS